MRKNEATCKLSGIYVHGLSDVAVAKVVNK